MTDNPNDDGENGLTDDYGNPLDGDRLIYCVYPNCGCDGERLCMAENGASDRSRKFNVEGMYRTKDGRARMRALGDIVSGEGKK